jgi:hypothetical protein
MIPPVISFAHVYALIIPAPVVVHRVLILEEPRYDLE